MVKEIILKMKNNRQKIASLRLLSGKELPPDLLLVCDGTVLDVEYKNGN